MKLQVTLTVMVILLCASLVSAQVSAPACCSSSSPVSTLVSVTPGAGSNPNLPFITVSFSNVRSDTVYVTATLLKSTLTYTSPCSTTSAKPTNTFFFPSIQPNATGISVQPLPTPWVRELAWKRTATTTGTISLTLPMQIAIQPPAGVTCTSTRTANICVVYRLTYIGNLQVSGFQTACVTYCTQVHTYSIKYDNTHILSFAELPSCP